MKSYMLFRKIENNYQIRHLDFKQTNLGWIQMTLMEYLEAKLADLHSEGKEEEIKQILNMDDRLLITPKKLNIMHKNPDNYVGLRESLENFETKKKKYTLRMNL